MLKYLWRTVAWVWNSASRTKGGTQIENAWEKGAEENIWTYMRGWRRMHNEELHNMYTSLNVRLIKLRWWNGQACNTWERWEMHTKFLSEKLKRRVHSEDVGVNGKIISEWVLTKQGRKMWTGCIWLRIEISGHGNEPLGFIKGRECLDYICGY